MRTLGHTVLVVAPEAGASGSREYEHDGVRVWRYGVTAAPTREEARGSIAARGAEAPALEREHPVEPARIGCPDSGMAHGNHVASRSQPCQQLVFPYTRDRRMADD